MERFIHQHRENVTGVLSGFDRLVLRGTLRTLSYAAGMMNFLYEIGVLLKEFGGYVERTTKQLRAACYEKAQQLDRPVIYLPSSQPSKEALAQQIAARDGISDGLICLLSCVEPCLSYELRRDREQQRLVLEPRQRKCLHLYHYWIDPVVWLHQRRLQTWFPYGNFTGEVISDYRRRREGIRVKHRMAANSIKMYDKHGRSLRVETTINDPTPFTILRAVQGNPDGPRSQRPMRRGISDLASRAQLSQAANERYLEALASLDVQHPLQHLIDPVCRPTVWQRRRERALRPWSPDDLRLLQTISGGEFTLDGLRNRDPVAAPRFRSTPARASAKSGWSTWRTTG